jgi:hypothetical protein
MQGVILPDGQISRRLRIWLSSPISKNIPLVPSGKSILELPPSYPTEGRAHVTNAGWDAVDATARFDETCWLRTAKPCGPGAPTLASSFA